MAFDRIEPFDDGYLQAAIISRTVANSFGGAKAKLSDFMPSRPTADAPIQSASDGLAVMRAVAAKHEAYRKMKK